MLPSSPAVASSAMKKVLVLAILCSTFAILMAAPAGAKQPRTTDAAVDALKKQLELVSTGQYGKAYGQMHPAQRAIMPQAVYITCASKTNPRGVSVDDVEVTATHKEPVVLPGTDVTAKGTAITVKLAYSRGIVKQSQTTTFHEFYVKGRWLFSVTGVYPTTKDC
jgi:hypothetical protein